MSDSERIEALERRVEFLEGLVKELAGRPVYTFPAYVPPVDNPPAIQPPHWWEQAPITITPYAPVLPNNTVGCRMN
jgi:hypothetical protein